LGVTWSNAGVLPATSVTYRLARANVGGTDYLYAATGQNGKVFRALLGPVGLEESPKLQAPSPKLNPAVVRGVLWMANGEGRQAKGVLLDASGRKVLDLLPGANDVSHLAPGVYLVRAAQAQAQAQGQAITKVVITR
jgi:hypothetical protein